LLPEDRSVHVHSIGNGNNPPLLISQDAANRQACGRPSRPARATPAPRLIGVDGVLTTFVGKPPIRASRTSIHGQGSEEKTAQKVVTAKYSRPRFVLLILRCRERGRSVGANCSSHSAIAQFGPESLVHRWVSPSSTLSFRPDPTRTSELASKTAEAKRRISDECGYTRGGDV
jgi:hypothetical protein